MLLIAIDGACRRNGKPDCTAAGGVFIKSFNEGSNFSELRSSYEYSSTNQRGEMLALLTALDAALQSTEEIISILTDSEYLFNAMTKGWYNTWHFNNWLTSSGAPVKNKDIWLEVKMLMDKCSSGNIELLFYHIKGHCIPFGTVTANNLLARDPSGSALFDAVSTKFDMCKATRQGTFKAANDLSERNNGFRLSDDIFKRFVVMNTIADAAATKVVDKADSSRNG